MTAIEFDAYDYCADQSFQIARYRLEGDERSGWRVARDGTHLLELGPGYRALRVRQCGVCSTDLARHFLPFELPQVIGHEVLTIDAAGRRFVVEINASHAARGLAGESAACPFCSRGLATHCPERVTLGIDRLPGGFGPWILAPTAACLTVPDSVDDDSAVLVEPLAAALHAVRSVAPRPGERIAVLGPRRLGMLVLGALAAWREQRGSEQPFSIHAVVRNPSLVGLADSMGADEVHVREAGDPIREEDRFDVVIDTTGNPAALSTAVALARREVHLKSTHGQAADGLENLTELVVDELSVRRLQLGENGSADPDGEARYRIPDGARVAWLAQGAVPAGLSARCSVSTQGAEASMIEFASAAASGSRLPHADVAVVDSLAAFAQAVRPIPGVERRLVRPRGTILLAAASTDAQQESALWQAIAARGLTLTSSRCGDFSHALRLLAESSVMRGVGRRFITHRFDAEQLPTAFRAASQSDCVKAVVRHAVEEPGPTANSRPSCNS
ncbi:MAG: alcohol dehydrogenase catalytic domain-containing protein [Planctomycetota bacterium]